MRVGLDIRYLSHGLTGGVRTYVFQLASRLPAAAPDLEFYYYADRKAPLDLAVPDGVTLRLLPWRSELTSLRNDRTLASHMDRDGIEVAHHPGNYGRRGRCPIVVTLHDSLNLFPLGKQIREMLGQPRRLAVILYLARRTRADLRRADAIITPSEHARQDLHRRTAYPLNQITAIHSAAGDEFRPVDDEPRREDVRRRFDLRRGVILADAIKNPLALVRAYQPLPPVLRDRFDVVFFSREARPRAELAAVLAGASGLRFIARPTTADLVCLMSLADLFVFPSWYEGFGLPLVEAMQCGAPVIGSTRGSIPEVLGRAGLLFDADRPDELRQLLARVLESKDEREAMRRRSLARAQAFSWDRTTRLTADVYRRTASRAVTGAISPSSSDARSLAAQDS